MTGLALSEQPAGRSLCSPEPMAGAGRLTPLPVKPAPAQPDFKALAARRAQGSGLPRGKGGWRRRRVTGDLTVPQHPLLPSAELSPLGTCPADAHSETDPVAGPLGPTPAARRTALGAGIWRKKKKTHGARSDAHTRVCTYHGGGTLHDSTPGVRDVRVSCDQRDSALRTRAALGTS